MYSGFQYRSFSLPQNISIYTHIYIYISAISRRHTRTRYSVYREWRQSGSAYTGPYTQQLRKARAVAYTAPVRLSRGDDTHTFVYIQTVRYRQQVGFIDLYINSRKSAISRLCIIGSRFVAHGAVFSFRVLCSPPQRA